MNTRIIKRILEKKHTEFLASIKDEQVRKLVDKNSIITGGSIVSLLLNETVKDYDYYFADKETCLAVAEYYVNEFNKQHPDLYFGSTTDKHHPFVKNENERIEIVVPSAGIASDTSESGKYEFFETLPNEYGEDYVEKVISEADETSAEKIETIGDERQKYHVVYMSSNAITLSDKIQVVIRFYGNAEDIHKNYDFVHCTNYWKSSDRKLYLNKEALECILTKQLIYQGSLYPICSVIRTRKFLKQGWHINAGQFLKMCMQISKLDLENIEILREQLTGVDQAYFIQIIEYCKQRMDADKEFKITTPYLVTIIDKIFG